MDTTHMTQDPGVGYGHVIKHDHFGCYASFPITEVSILSMQYCHFAFSIGRPAVFIGFEGYDGNF